MQKKTVILILFIFINSIIMIQGQVTANSNGEKKTFKHIVLVTYDGARKFWVDTLMNNGTLPNLKALKDEGAEITLRIIDHDPSTDPGLACIESGYGPDVTGIESNYFGSPIELKRSIPDGLTTTERIKAVYGDSWKTGLVMPW
ncbi:alkaline phosphatase family protein, partial [Candidatus Bathyarchaeota archaeon]|nr:alkaline phosphatase family protein [Candidatus Bathyarchaeota archaeon]